jgi:two-component system LytT family response regulator
LIAEDDPEMRRVLKKVAEENKNLRVVGEAVDGTEALAKFEELRPDVVFIDIDLPGKDGVALAREIFDCNPRTRLVFITAHEQYRKEAFSVYACDYIVKPFKIDRLSQTLVSMAT